MNADFQDITIFDLDVHKTTWSRVHSSMRTLYLKLSREPDQAWSRFFFEDRTARVEVKRHGLWIEEGYIVFDCMLEDVDSHHLPDIRQSVAYANRRSHELAEARRAENERARAATRNEQRALDDLRARIRGERTRSPVVAPAPAPEPMPEPTLDLPIEPKLELELGPPLELEPLSPVLPTSAPMEPEPEQRGDIPLADMLPPAPEPMQPANELPVEDLALAPQDQQRSEIPPEDLVQPALAAQEREDIPFADALPPTPPPDEQGQAPAEDAPPPGPAEDSMQAEFEERRKDWRTRFRVALALASKKKEGDRGND